jgi:signal transduction histidine kinase
MAWTRAELADRAIGAVDWFIPAELRASNATLWRARHFVISHVLGPFSAIAIFGHLYHVLPEPDIVFWTLCALCGCFWLLPVGLKLTGQLIWLALFSFWDLTFLSVLASFVYGGVSSPFLPWLLCALLIGFFYLNNRARLVVTIFAAHLAGFCIAYFSYGSFPSRVPVAELSTVGVISVLCATLYSSMMAIYYAYVMTEQSALRQEIDKHVITAQKLRQAKQAAECADTARAIFLAKMNHQLRTPLNAIIGYSEILLEEIEPNVDSADEADLKTINTAGRHLLSLVSDVLYIPSSDIREQVELAIRPVDLDRCLNVVVATCMNLVSQNGNELILEKPDVLGFVETDDTRLRQILINLLSNAGKFTRNGKVTLRAERHGSAELEQIVISVADSGIGIPQEAISTLSTKFNRANAATSQAYGGSGLGLAVSYELAQLLDGVLSVESEQGRGSTFTLRLPAAVPIAAAA